WLPLMVAKCWPVVVREAGSGLPFPMSVAIRDSLFGAISLSFLSGPQVLLPEIGTAAWRKSHSAVVYGEFEVHFYLSPSLQLGFQPGFFRRVCESLVYCK